MILRYFLLVTMIVSFASSGYAEFYRYQNNNGVTVFTDDLARVPENQRETASQYEDSPSLDVPDEGNAADEEDMDRASLSDIATSLEDQVKTGEAEEVEDQSDPDSMNGNDQGEAESQRDSEETEIAASGDGEGLAEPESGLQASDAPDSDGNATEKNNAAAGKGLIDPDSLNQEKIRLDQEYLALHEQKEMLKKTKPNLKSKDEIQDYHEKIVNINERISIYENHRKAYSDKVDAYNLANSK